MNPFFFFVLALFIVPLSVSAHASSGTDGGLLSGILHPIMGVDHAVAMLAVGVWGVFLGRPAVFLLPVLFPLVMAIGGAFGSGGGAIPSIVIEMGIALSAIIFGLMILLASKTKLTTAALLVSVFALCHGYAHGSEIPDAAHPLMYAIGFVAATGTLHLIGIFLGTILNWSTGRLGLRITGCIIMLIGVRFLLDIT